jgi:nucleotide-binding universal stress UspA family protein
MDAKTVVGWNGSARAEAAVDWAIGRETPRGGRIVLVFVVEDEAGVLDDVEAERQLKVARAALRDAAERVRGLAPGCEVKTTAVRGPAVESLLDFVGAGWVLAVGAFERSSAPLPALHTVGARLAAAGRGPVAVIPGGGGAPGAGVVVGIDGTIVGAAAAVFAAAEAARVGELLTVVHAWSEPAIMEGLPILDPPFVDALSGASALLLAEARELVLREVPGVQVATRSLNGHAAPCLLRASAGARELVVGSRGVRGIRRILLGSVSRDVVARIECPTIIVGQTPKPRGRTADDGVGRALALEGY